MKWFTSDHHIDHKNILTLGDGRPFPNLDAQWRVICDNWNDRVGVDDEVFVIGDWSMNAALSTLGKVAMLNGAVYLVPGNHDDVWRRPSRAGRYMAAGWAGVLPTFAMVGPWALSHLPPAGVCHYTDGDERFMDQRPVWPGPIIHGHTHSPARLTGLQLNSVHVGVDAWDFCPVSADQVADLLNPG